VNKLSIKDLGKEVTSPKLVKRVTDYLDKAPAGEIYHWTDVCNRLNIPIKSFDRFLMVADLQPYKFYYGRKVYLGNPKAIQKAIKRLRNES
jgi:hypothetical protein